VPTPNENLQQLSDIVDKYCKKRRSESRGAAYAFDEAGDLRNFLRETLPPICNLYSDVPDPIFAEKIIDLAVEGISEREYKAVWEQYIKTGYTLFEFANQINYTERTASRFIKTFPQKAAGQLWMHSLNLLPDRRTMPVVPVWRRGVKILREEYGLSDTLATALVIFILAGNRLTRAEITSGILLISSNTLKAHIRRFNDRLGTKDLHEAESKAEDMICRRLGDEWLQFKDSLSDKSKDGLIEFLQSLCGNHG
jgi:hypothetical protein